MTEIDNLLRQEIAYGGPIPFARFMEVALYCPKLGYYERESGVIGFGGGFYTGPSAGPPFWPLLGVQLVEGGQKVGAGPLGLVEGCGHDGAFAAGLLEWLGEKRPQQVGRLPPL